MAKTLTEGQEILRTESQSPLEAAYSRLVAYFGTTSEETLKSEPEVIPVAETIEVPETAPVVETIVIEDAASNETLEKGMSAPPVEEKEEEDDDDNEDEEAEEGGDDVDNESSDDDEDEESDEDDEEGEDEESDDSDDSESDEGDESEGNPEEEESEGDEEESDEGDDEDEDGEEEQQEEQQKPPVRKSLDEAASGADFVEALKESPYASLIEGSDALLATVEEFAYRLDQQRSDTTKNTKAVRDIAKSVASLGELSQKVNELSAMVGILVLSAERTLAKQDAIAKSLADINNGVELVKSQPQLGGGWGVGAVRPPSRGADVEGRIISKQDVSRAISNAVNTGKLTPSNAATHLLALNGSKTLDEIVKGLPDEILTLLK